MNGANTMLPSPRVTRRVAVTSSSGEPDIASIVMSFMRSIPPRPSRPCGVAISTRRCFRVCGMPGLRAVVPGLLPGIQFPVARLAGRE